MKKPLKPSKDELQNTLANYFVNHGNGEFERQLITMACNKIDRAMRIVTKTALKDVPQSLKVNLFPNISLDTSAVPKATSVGDRAYRISIPIEFIFKLLSTGATRDGVVPTVESNIYWPSIFIASLAAYGHELNHIFSGHLKTSSSNKQELNSDLRAGALTLAWLKRQDIQKEFGISPGAVEHNCFYAFMHLASIFSDSNECNSIYLHRSIRFATYCAGAVGYANALECGDNKRIVQAVNALPVCPDSNFISHHIAREANDVLRDPQPDESEMLKEISSQMPKSKKEWYDSSQHLRPIKPQLQRIVKIDAKSVPKNGVV